MADDFLPSAVKQLTNLQYLKLRGSLLFGHQVSRCLAQLTRLTRLDIARL